MTELQLSNLPNLPQRASIVEAASNLWPEAEVVALWLGGSLARGAGDLFSDVDFRVAVTPDQLAPWKTPRFERIFTHTTVAGQGVMQFGDDAVLHHLVLSNGEIFDFFVQSATRLPTREPLLILGCRSEEFERKLAGQNSIPPVERQAVDGEVVRDLLVSFWINSHKHRKVLYRGLDVMATLGLHIEQGLLLRLWYIEVSGQDCGDMGRQTIHSLTEVVQTIERAMGPQALALLGAPMGDRQELCQTIERNRQAVSQHLGRRLAQQYGLSILLFWKRLCSGGGRYFWRGGESITRHECSGAQASSCLSFCWKLCHITSPIGCRYQRQYSLPAPHLPVT